jgi:hypothetical protein
MVVANSLLNYQEEFQMGKITSTFFALSFLLSLSACEDRRSDQPGEKAREGVSEGINDMKRDADDATEGDKGDLGEGASDVKRSAEDATD